MTAPDQPDIVNLRPGELYSSRVPVWIRTVLGSCVAVCLYDSVAGVGGMNHFMLPGSGNGEQFPTHYGLDAMCLLIEQVTSLGGMRDRLTAKAFGGANVLSMHATLPTVAENNIAFISRFLQEEGIPLTNSRLGGNAPLEVRFFTGTARTLVKPVKSRRTASLGPRELQLRAEVDTRLSDLDALSRFTRE